MRCLRLLELPVLMVFFVIGFVAGVIYAGLRKGFEAGLD